MSRKILVTGAGGQVGQALASSESEYELVAVGREELDIADPASVEAVVSTLEPDFIINAAAYTAVDLAEQEPEKAFAVNRDGVANLARTCRGFKLPLLHISTDYVFDGTLTGAYRERDPVTPIGVYGRSKAEGEMAARKLLDRLFILRTSWVFSETGNNFVKTMLRLGKERDRLGIVSDQKGCPTSAASIARTLLDVADRYLHGDEIEWGTFHFCNSPPTSWYEFALRIFECADGYEQLRVDSITTADYPTPATRPQNSVLDCGKLKRQFKLDIPHWEDELDLVLEKLGAR